VCRCSRLFFLCSFAAFFPCLHIIRSESCWARASSLLIFRAAKKARRAVGWTPSYLQNVTNDRKTAGPPSSHGGLATEHMIIEIRNSPLKCFPPSFFRFGSVDLGTDCIFSSAVNRLSPLIDVIIAMWSVTMMTAVIWLLLRTPPLLTCLVVGELTFDGCALAPLFTLGASAIRGIGTDYKLLLINSCL
jgi:hypothetical protein